MFGRAHITFREEQLPAEEVFRRIEHFVLRKEFWREVFTVGLGVLMLLVGFWGAIAGTEMSSQFGLHLVPLP